MVNKVRQTDGIMTGGREELMKVNDEEEKAKL